MTKGTMKAGRALVASWLRQSRIVHLRLRQADGAVAPPRPQL